MGGLERAPQAPRRSGRPGKAVAPHGITLGVLLAHFDTFRVQPRARFLGLGAEIKLADVFEDRVDL